MILYSRQAKKLMLVNCTNYLSMLIILHYSFTVVKVKSLTGREFSQVFHWYPVKAKKERKGGNTLGIPALHERMKECDRIRPVLRVLFYHSLSRLASVLFAVFFRALACGGTECFSHSGCLATVVGW
jgi:hypothetical protein